eukprot:TRINITY_DN2443_c0_g1_i5.p2 TRINITY_DN2443_c0_g1~~TRINITY_DN2443_c0_g1_i5.p2  ORF type:complete len:138 (-),score=1.17 TRINITY_DN2443_c0_g1_i5:317-730(-)
MTLPSTFVHSNLSSLSSYTKALSMPDWRSGALALIRQHSSWTMRSCASGNRASPTVAKSGKICVRYRNNLRTSCSCPRAVSRASSGIGPDVSKELTSEMGVCDVSDPGRHSSGVHRVRKLVWHQSCLAPSQACVASS